VILVLESVIRLILMAADVRQIALTACKPHSLREYMECTYGTLHACCFALVAGHGVVQYYESVHRHVSVSVTDVQVVIVSNCLPRHHEEWCKDSVEDDGDQEDEKEDPLIPAESQLLTQHHHSLNDALTPVPDQVTDSLAVEQHLFHQR
jgi:hypothetical protein